MHLFLLGAPGRVGGHILAQALAAGHHVTALVRNPAKIPGQLLTDSLNLVQGDAASEHDLLKAMARTQAVVSCLSTDGGTLLSDSMPLILNSMKELGIRRIITTGTAGILQSREYTGRLRYESPETKRSSTRAAEEHRKAWGFLASSGLDWTCVCPTYLPDGERMGSCRAERDYLPEGGTSISVADTADFAYKQLVQNAYIGCRVGIAY